MFNQDKDIGIDLGTANTLIYIKNKGIVLNEPSVVAVETKTKKIVSVGKEAKDMIGKNPPYLEVIQPLEEGVIFDFQMTVNMLKHFLFKVIKRITPFSRIRVSIGVPSAVTEVEKRAVEEVLKEMSIKEVYIIDEPLAAAVGIDVDISSSTASIICDIGGGTSDIAVLALNGIMTATSIRFAGDDLNRALIEYLKKKYDLLVGVQTAEEVKINAGTAFLDEETIKNPKVTFAKGRDIVSGLPKTVKITSKDTYEALEDSCLRIIQSIKNTLEKTPPEMAADIESNGIILTGGGALLNGLDKLVKRETGLKVFIPENAQEAVVVGAGKSLDDIEKLKIYSQNSNIIEI